LNGSARFFPWIFDVILAREFVQSAAILQDLAEIRHFLKKI
jgi:hypothetical protein